MGEGMPKMNKGPDGWPSNEALADSLVQEQRREKEKAQMTSGKESDVNLFIKYEPTEELEARLASGKGPDLDQARAELDRRNGVIPQGFKSTMTPEIEANNKRQEEKWVQGILKRPTKELRETKIHGGDAKEITERISAELERREKEGS